MDLVGLSGTIAADGFCNDKQPTRHHATEPGQDSDLPDSYQYASDSARHWSNISYLGVIFQEK